MHLCLNQVQLNSFKLIWILLCIINSAQTQAKPQSYKLNWIKIFDKVSGGHSSNIYSLCSLDNGLLASGDNIGIIKIWNTRLDHGELTFTFDKDNGGHMDRVGLLVKLENDLMASASNDNLIKIWNVNMGILIFTYSNLNGDQIRSLIKLNENLLAFGSATGEISILNYQEEKLVFTFEGNLDGHQSSISSLLKFDEANANGLKLLSESFDKTIKMWDLDQFKLSLTLNLNEMESSNPNISTQFVFNQMIQLENTSLIASLIDSYENDESNIQIYDVNKQIRKYKFDSSNGCHRDMVKLLCKLNDGLIASASEDKTIKIWDTNEGKLKVTFDQTNDGHTGFVWLLLKLDNGFLISASNDKTIKVWNVNSQQLLYTLNEKTDGFNSLVISLVKLDDNMIATGSTDGSIKIYKLASSSLILRQLIFNLAFVLLIYYFISTKITN